MKRLAVIICTIVLLAACKVDEEFFLLSQSSLYTSNVKNEDIRLKVLLKRYKVAYYEPHGTQLTCDHEHHDDHVHDQNDDCVSTPELKQFRSLYINVNLLTTLQGDDKERHVGVADNDRFIAEVNGVRFELFRDYSYMISGKVKSVLYGQHFTLIDSRYHPEVFFNAASDTSQPSSTDYEDFVIRFLIEREDGSVAEARVSSPVEEDVALSINSLDEYTTELVANALNPSITHVDIYGNTAAAQQQMAFAKNSHGDYQTPLFSPDLGWGFTPFQPHDSSSIDLYCSNSNGLSRYYDGSLLNPQNTINRDGTVYKVASTGVISIDQSTTNYMEGCADSIVRFFKVIQTSPWTIARNDFASVSFVYGTTTSTRQITPK